MDRQQDFDDRIAEIYALGNLDPRDGGLAVTEDTRRAEFRAMAGAFLGDDYDQATLKQVEALQHSIDERRSRLIGQLERAEIGPEEYLDSFNASAAEMFAAIEEILGPGDFVKLFRVPRAEMGDVIDRQVFLQEQSAGLRRDREGVAEVPPPASTRVPIDDSNLIACYANFCRVIGTPEELIIDFGLNPQPFGIVTQPIAVVQRIITNFYTAKRMLYALQVTVERHEATFGAMEVNVDRRIRMQAGHIASTQ